MRLGIDVSNNNGMIDWKLVGLSGITLAMVKVSQGTDYQDQWAKRNIQGAIDAGIMVGGYHFAQPSLNRATDEANFAFHCCAVLPPLTLFALDLEDDNEATPWNLATWASDWLEDFEALSVHTARLYSSPDYIATHALGGIRQAERYRLWLASWTSHEPTSPWPWTTLDGWQFEAGSRWPGIDSVDLSIWDFE